MLRVYLCAHVVWKWVDVHVTVCVMCVPVCGGACVFAQVCVGVHVGVGCKGGMRMRAHAGACACRGLAPHPLSCAVST